jgi:hypothetical protein
VRFGRIGMVRVAVIAGLAAVAVPSTAHAADLSIPLDSMIVSGVAQAEQVELALVASDRLTGQTCSLRAVHGESAAVHPGNDLVVTSGDGTATLPDVERAPGAITDGSAAITLGEVIKVDLVMGPDEQFGGDMELELDCDGAPAPATDPSALPATDPSALPVTGPWSTAIGLLLGTLLIVAGYGLTVLARPPEQS